MGNLVSLADKFLPEGVPDFFDGAAEYCRNGKKRALDDGDAHVRDESRPQPAGVWR